MPYIKKTAHKSDTRTAKRSIYDIYFDHARDNQKEIDGNIVVLMQVGSFYEMYYASPMDGAPPRSSDGDYARLRGAVIRACKACDLKHIKKQSSSVAETYEIYMAGFGLNQLEKYLSWLIEDHGFTVAVYDQDFDGPNAPRSLRGIYSPGTYISDNHVSLTNHIMCVWIEVTRRLDRVHIGVATIDAGTSKTTCDEYAREYHLQPTTFDDVERSIAIFRPSEIIFIGNIPSDDLEAVVSFVNKDCKAIKCYSSIVGDPMFNAHLMNCHKQTYQDGLIQRLFPNAYSETFFHDFIVRPVGAQAFCFLLHFIQIHNERLLYDLEAPKVGSHKTARDMVLANNCLEQLNVIDPRGNLRVNINANTEAVHQRSRTRSSVRSLIGYLDECLTRIGRREFHHILQHPIYDAARLEESYALTSHILSKPTSFIDGIRNQMRGLSDCEHFHYKTRVQRVCPFDFHVLYHNLVQSFDLVQMVSSDAVLHSFFETRLSHIIEPCSNSSGDAQSALAVCRRHFREASNFIKSIFDIDLIGLEKSSAFQKNIFIVGNYPELDEKYESHKYAGVKLDAIRDLLDSYLVRTEKTSSAKSKSRGLVNKIEHNATPIDLGITERRAGNLRREIERVISANNGNPTVDIAYSRDERDTANKTNGELPATTTQTIKFDLSQIQFRPRSTHTTKPSVEQIIVHPTVRDLAVSVLTSGDELAKHLHEAFADVVNRFCQQFRATLNLLVTFIRHLDVLQCKAHVARTCHLARPSVVSEDETAHSFVHIDGLRHCLVEANSIRETYVTNNVRLGTDPSTPGPETENGSIGILLYGTNAVGKTCLIKALGMAVLMAQAGFYVPCDAMRFSPYRHIFTRIVNRDDIFRGLSTFALEMSELRTILQLHNERSLVLGDELCSGTENVSAISIFVAGLEKLHAANASFIFATHFHELQNLHEVKSLDRLAMKHMKVRYDVETKRLIYDRKLCDGCGDAMYGLEVCRSLSLADEFLARAHEIRAHLSQHSTVEPPVLKQKRAAYSRKKLVGICERCKKNPANEVHHLVPQKNAGDDGYVKTDRGTFHKDHPANLKALCEECHHLEHHPRHR